MTITISKQTLHRVLTGLFFLVLLIGGLTACDISSGGGGDNSNAAQNAGQAQNADAYSRLSAAEPPPVLKDSLSRKEIIQRYNLFNDVTKFGYFYAFVQGEPQPIIEYVVQGGVFSVNDLISPTQSQVQSNNCNTGNCDNVVESPQPDGTFGSNGDGLFGFTADGSYFEWNGIYYFGTEPAPNLKPLQIIGCVSKAQC